MKKILAIVALLTLSTSVLGGCKRASTIGNPYVPASFVLDGIEYNMEEDHLPTKLTENGWTLNPDGKNVVVIKEFDVKKNKTQYQTIHYEFFMTLKKDAAKYETIADYQVKSIEFERGKVEEHFAVKGTGFDISYQDAKMKFGENAKTVTAEDNSPMRMTYSGKTRTMTIEFDNWRTNKFVFTM